MSNVLQNISDSAIKTNLESSKALAERRMIGSAHPRTMMRDSGHGSHFKKMEGQIGAQMHSASSRSFKMKPHGTEIGLKGRKSMPITNA